VSAHRGRMCRGIVDASSLRLVVPGRIKRELPSSSPSWDTTRTSRPFTNMMTRFALVGVSHADVIAGGSGWRNVTLPLLSIRSLRTLTPAPTRIIGPDGLALARASKATLGGLRSLAR